MERQGTNHSEQSFSLKSDLMAVIYKLEDIDMNNSLQKNGSSLSN